MRLCNVPGPFSQPRQGPSGTPAKFTGYPERDRGTPTQLDTSAPSSPASVEALIFFCLLFFYQEKKRRNPSACVCPRKETNTGVGIQSFDPRGSSVGRMQYASTNGDAPLDLFLRTCPLSGPFVGRMQYAPTNGASPLDSFLCVCPLLGPFVGRMQYAPTNGAAPLDIFLRTCPLSGPFVGRMLLRPTNGASPLDPFLLFFP